MGQLASQTTVSANRIPHGYCQRNRQQVTAMLSEGLVLLWGLLLCAMDGGVGGCECPLATILAQFPPELPHESCCLNYSGSSFASVTWALFSDVRNLEVLDLSDCNITHLQDAAASPAWLREAYLGRNMLRKLPEGFLANATQLRVLDLGGNFLERLPDDFLQGSVRLRELRLVSNRLAVLPRGALQPSLERLELSGNVWDCSCALVEDLQGRQGNDSSWQGAVGNLTCASPAWLAGRSAWSVRTGDVCQGPTLTVLFILVPLLLLLALGLCWCCGRRRKKKRKEAGLRSTKWVPDPGATNAQHRNGSQHERRRGRPRPGGAPEAGGGMGRDVLLKNQLMFRPSSDLLGSSRDLYEEVEVKLGSADSLAPPPSEDLPAAPGLEAREPSEGQGEDDRADPETVSVTEVMKDSADREKAYLAQSTEYYSLVPGIDLEDSDHAEYESVDLS
ncbi:leucine-rich repeat-containing protein 26 isoform X1 [Anguilla anguilla]|uniref:leucine-rich repeat-containing protein 26 isoform X1 n=2 Tax=Anguilla anguilla TaxID=7936 RepID=UPI0015B2BEC9|nr:leucine-rich repeat-containing protein 26 isoform X1 [Anguilla anguilla]